MQKELQALQASYTPQRLQTHIFQGDFRVFSSVAMLVGEYDMHFGTIHRLGDLLGEDFSNYATVAGMNIKNFYENTENPIAIEAVNRFLWFWIGINTKSLSQKLGQDVSQSLSLSVR